MLPTLPTTSPGTKRGNPERARLCLPASVGAKGEVGGLISLEASASADTAATADAGFDVRRNGSSIGTIRFGAGATAPTFIAVAATTLQFGDELAMVAPASVDASLTNLVTTIIGNLIV